MAGPTFIVIGAMKAGTTSLWSYLRTHPEIFMTEIKEPRFFIEKFNWGRGVDWYESLFAGAEGAKARGEASVEYSMRHAHQGVPERIAGLYPDVKLIYLMRHPIERMRSQYFEDFVSGVETRPIDRALREHPTYLLCSAYRFQIERYLACFRRDQILLLTSESLRSSRQDTLRGIFEYLGVDPSFVPPTIDTEAHRTEEKKMMAPAYDRLRSSRIRGVVERVVPAGAVRALHRVAMRPVRPVEAKIPPDLEQELLDQLRPGIAALRTYLGPDFDCWGLA